MSKDEFEKIYCEKSKITRDFYNEYFVTLPCNFGEKDCKGWACVCNNPLSIKCHMELYA